MEIQNIEFGESECSYFERPIFKRKFAEIKPTIKDFESDCHDVQVLESENKKPKLSQSNDNLHLICKWKECPFETNVAEIFVLHVAHHIPAPQGNIKSVKNGKRALSYACLWDGCPFKSNVLNAIYKHVNYHSYHTKLLAIGLSFRGRVELPKCHRKQSSNSVIERLQSLDQICGWNGCNESFTVYQLYLSHVHMHAKNSYVEKRSRKKRFKCKWTGCTMGFYRLKNLRSHIKTHTKEKSIACPDCYATFCANTKFVTHCKRQGPSDWDTKVKQKTDGVISDFGTQTRIRTPMRRETRLEKMEEEDLDGRETGFELSTSKEYYSSCEIDGEIVLEGEANFQESEVDPLEELYSSAIQEIKSEDTMNVESLSRIDKEMKKECGTDLFIEKVFCIQDQESQSLDSELQLQNELHAAVEEVMFEKTKITRQIESVDIDQVLSTEVHNLERIQERNFEISNEIWKSTNDRDSSVALCRLCANPSIDMIHIFRENEIYENIIGKIECCLPIMVRKTDTLTKQVCRSCVEKLESLYEFYETVSKAEEKLLILDTKISNEIEETEIHSQNFVSSDEQSGDIEYDNNEVKRQIPSDKNANNNKFTNIVDQQVQMADGNLDNRDLSSNSELCSNKLFSTKDNLLNDESKRRCLSTGNDYLTANFTMAAANSDRKLLSQNEERENSKEELNCNEEISVSEDNSLPITRSRKVFNRLKRTVKEVECDKCRGLSIERNVSSTDCGTGFKEEFDEAVHDVQEHGAETSYSCDCCDRKLISKSGRDYHRRFMRGKRVSESSRYAESSAMVPKLKHGFIPTLGERTLLCFICDESFESLEARAQHMIKHTCTTKTLTS